MNLTKLALSAVLAVSASAYAAEDAQAPVQETETAGRNYIESEEDRLVREAIVRNHQALATYTECLLLAQAHEFPISLLLAAGMPARHDALRMYWKDIEQKLAVCEKNKLPLIDISTVRVEKKP